MSDQHMCDIGWKINEIVDTLHVKQPASTSVPRITFPDGDFIGEGFHRTINELSAFLEIKDFPALNEMDDFQMRIQPAHINKIIDKVNNLTLSKWEYTLNDTDNVIIYKEKAIPDVSQDFEIEGYWDLSFSGTLLSQNTSSTSSSREFQIWNRSQGLVVVIGGEPTNLDFDAKYKNAGHINIIRKGSMLALLKDGELISTSETATTGAAREAGAVLTIGARKAETDFSAYYGGVCKDVKIWAGGDRKTGTLTVHSPIDDNSDTIANKANDANSGTLMNMDQSRWAEGDIPSTEFAYFGFCTATLEGVGGYSSSEVWALETDENPEINFMSEIDFVAGKDSSIKKITIGSYLRQEDIDAGKDPIAKIGIYRRDTLELVHEVEFRGDTTLGYKWNDIVVDLPLEEGATYFLGVMPNGWTKWPEYNPDKGGSVVYQMGESQVLKDLYDKSNRGSSWILPCYATVQQAL